MSKSALYQQEKANRKEENHKKHNEQAKEIMRKKRNKKRMEEKAIMEKLHQEATIELSYFSPISKVAIRKSCCNCSSLTTTYLKVLENLMKSVRKNKFYTYSISHKVRKPLVVPTT